MIDLLPWHRQPLSELLARRDKLPHALLIHGQQGIGKTEFAKALAQSLLCEAPEASQTYRTSEATEATEATEFKEGGIACGECNACHWFRDGNHPDYRELLPENLVEEDSGAEADTSVEADPKDKKKSKEI